MGRERRPPGLRAHTHTHTPAPPSPTPGAAVPVSDGSCQRRAEERRNRTAPERGHRPTTPPRLQPATKRLPTAHPERCGRRPGAAGEAHRHGGSARAGSGAGREAPAGRHNGTITAPRLRPPRAAPARSQSPRVAEAAHPMAGEERRSPALPLAAIGARR